MESRGYMIKLKETAYVILISLGKRIDKVSLEDNELRFSFSDGTNLKLFDNGQSCCEYRIMTTSDELEDYIGSILLDFEMKSAPNVYEEDGEHEIKFLDVKTSKGTFQMVNHNIHNGYYGGFRIIAKLY